MKKLKKREKKRGLETTTHTLIGVCDFKLSPAELLNTKI